MSAAEPTPEPPGPLRRAWPHLRGVLVLLHLIAISLMAAPSPGSGMKRSAWSDPTVQAEFAVWVERLNGAGIAVTSEAFEDHLWALASEVVEVRTTLLKPFRGYYKYAGTAQSWRMFIAPHRYPARLEIEVQEKRAWRRVYVARDPELDWMAEQLDHDRLRSAVFRYGWKHYGGTWKRFAAWLAEEAAEDFPEAQQIRLRMFKYKTQTPEQVRAGAPLDGEYINEQRIPLGPIRRGRAE